MQLRLLFHRAVVLELVLAQALCINISQVSNGTCMSQFRHHRKGRSDADALQDAEIEKSVAVDAVAVLLLLNLQEVAAALKIIVSHELW